MGQQKPTHFLKELSTRFNGVKLLVSFQQSFTITQTKTQSTGQ